MWKRKRSSVVSPLITLLKQMTILSKYKQHKSRSHLETVLRDESQRRPPSLNTGNAPGRRHTSPVEGLRSYGIPYLTLREAVSVVVLILPSLPAVVVVSLTVAVDELEIRSLSVIVKDSASKVVAASVAITATSIALTVEAALPSR
ncbi:hypothetical protein K501DRAFT_268100 [Backusella circina FSU 941]|nr:hypothetical protein K501DRAFT_268100 [Backusella circina FSU 941]